VSGLVVTALGFLGAVLLFLMTLLVPLLQKDLEEGVPWFVVWLVRRAAGKLGAEHQARFEEEWLAELAAVPGAMVWKLGFALRVSVRAHATSRAMQNSPPWWAEILRRLANATARTRPSPAKGRQLVALELQSIPLMVVTVVLMVLNSLNRFMWDKYTHVTSILARKRPVSRPQIVKAHAVTTEHPRVLRLAANPPVPRTETLGSPMKARKRPRDQPLPGERIGIVYAATEDWDVWKRADGWLAIERPEKDATEDHD
jgi:hypothetical protein